MFHSEEDFLANLIVLTPKLARKKFRESIFEAWGWRCAYCDRQLCNNTATIDHIIPKHKGGHNTRRNMLCSCSNCNRKKGSSNWQSWYQATNYYSHEKEKQIMDWIVDFPLGTELLHVNYFGCP